MVDGLNIEKSLNTYDAAREQSKAADILLLNKKDLLNEFQLRRINLKLKEINPTAPILLIRHDDINPALVYGVDPQDVPAEDHRNKLQRERLHPSHQHDGLSSYKISLAGPLERERFIETIQLIPHAVFRVKGIADFIGDDKPLLFQYVGGRFEFSEFNNPKMSDRFLVLSG
jgi:G3E family GTPase